MTTPYALWMIHKGRSKAIFERYPSYSELFEFHLSSTRGREVPDSDFHSDITNLNQIPSSLNDFLFNPWNL